LKQEEEKEQLRVTSTGTPAEDKEEEEKREVNYQVIRIRDDTSKIVYPKNYRRDVFSGLTIWHC
jgi:hypothetical protein